MFIRRSWICKLLGYSFLLFWISSAFIVFNRFSPSDDTSLISAFSYVRRQIYTRWEKEALSLYPSHLETNIVTSLASPKFVPVKYGTNITDNEFLCAVFVEADTIHLKHLVANMDNIRSGCNWAVVATGGDAELFDSYLKTIKAMKHVKVVLYKFATSRVDLFTKLNPDNAEQILKRPLSFNNISYPKAALLSSEIMPLASAYKYIWLPHPQVDLSHFSFRKFVKSVHCAYFPALGPLLAQPLVKLRHSSSDLASDPSSSSSSSLWPNYMQFDKWKAIEDVYAVRTDFIAMNSAPIFRSDFFQWFVAHLSDPTLQAANILGSQYLYDGVVCAAARAYGDKLAASEKKETGVVPCALVINSSPLALHSDDPSRATDFTGDQHLLDEKVKTMTHKAFPTWFIDAEQSNSSPLHNATVYRRSFRLNHACLES